MSTRITGLLFLLFAASTPGCTVGSLTDLEAFDPVALTVAPSAESAGAFDIALTPRGTDSCPRLSRSVDARVNGRPAELVSSGSQGPQLAGAACAPAVFRIDASALAPASTDGVSTVEIYDMTARVRFEVVAPIAPRTLAPRGAMGDIGAGGTLTFDWTPAWDVPDVVDATFTPTDGDAKPRAVRGKVEGGAIVVVVPKDLAAGRYDLAVSWRGTAEIASCEGVETCRLPVGAIYGMGLRVQ